MFVCAFDPVARRSLDFFMAEGRFDFETEDFAQCLHRLKPGRGQTGMAYTLVLGNVP